MQLLKETKIYKKGDINSILEYLHKVYGIEIKEVITREENRYALPQNKPMEYAKELNLHNKMHKEIHDFIQYGHWRIMFPHAGPISFGHANSSALRGSFLLTVYPWEKWKEIVEKKRLNPAA